MLSTHQQTNDDSNRLPFNISDLPLDIFLQICIDLNHNHLFILLRVSHELHKFIEVLYQHYVRHEFPAILEETSTISDLPWRIQYLGTRRDYLKTNKEYRNVNLNQALLFYNITRKQLGNIYHTLN